VKSVAFSIFYIQQLIKHYWSATLIDVLHSPFVFALYNDCFKRNSNIALYDSDELGLSRAEAIIEKLKIHFAGHKYVTGSPLSQPDVPVIWKITKPLDWKWIVVFWETTHNDSFILLPYPYRNLTVWKQLNLLPNTTAVIDLFVIGLVFKRKEQRKEYFRLRAF
jgi:hypothetical protein